MISFQRIDAFVQPEPALVILGFAIGAWVIYKLLLRDVSTDRHLRMRGYFSDLIFHLFVGGGLYAAYWGITHGESFAAGVPWTSKLASWIGLATLLSGAVIAVKSWRILIFEYLVFGRMKAGVPVLLVNLFTLLATLGLTGWILSAVFAIRLAPILATSAVFSLVVGLALQDTLGNLFSGVALQMDKPYEIGDWIEVNDGATKWVGQVDEITWRATVLIGFTDEALTIPNRVMGQAKIANYSAKSRPFVRSQTFRIPYGAPIDLVKRLLIEIASKTSGVLETPAPFALISEAQESWISVRLIYFLDRFGQQYLVADQILTAALERFREEGIRLAAPRIVVHAADGSAFSEGSGTSSSGDKTPPSRTA